MTNEEAIERLSLLKIFDAPDLNEAVKMAISALRAQQAPAKLDRSRWEGRTHCENRCCCTCKYSTTSETKSPCKECDVEEMHDPQNFCPNCGRPLTEEAWAELERRITP